MKSYCTQNNGDCSTCSLVSYGRDCRNNPIAGGIIEDMTPDEIECAAVRHELEIVRLDEATFKREMARAQTFKDLGSDAEYWAGYQRGLRRAFHGESFGTPEEHALWAGLSDDEDTTRHERGQGYCDGLRGATER